MWPINGWKRHKVFRRAMLLQELEQRIVLDAAVADQPQSNNVDHPVNADMGEQAAGTGQPVVQAAAQPAAEAVAPHQAGTDHPLDVVLISNAVSDVEAISKAVAPDAKVIVYDAAHDNLATIDQKLGELVATTGEKIEHIAILSHGEAGVLKLSSTSVFNAASVQSNSADWYTLSTLMTDDARIDLYACIMGQGDQGAALVQSIAHATHATVWASNDMTGTATGADWDLEVKTAESSLSALIDPSLVHADGMYLTSAPVADSQTVIVNEDGTLTITVTGTDTDDPAANMVAFGVTNPVTHGTLSEIGAVTRISAGHYSQQFLYTPNHDYSGSDSFDFVLKTPKDPVWNGFRGGNSIGTYDETYSVALGDVNGDGKLDVIAGNYYESSKVYLGNGSGGFTLYGNVGTDTDSTRSVALGDVNGDGKLDVIAGNYGQTNKVYLGNGSGGFSAGTDIGTDTDRTWSVALGDVNGDGKLDVIAGNTNYNKVYLGNGSGGFSYYGTVGTDTYGANSVALGDVNGDGKLDVIAGNTNYNKVYLGNGSGGFTLYGTVGTDTDYTLSVALGDVNGDGKLDVIAGNYGQTNKVYLGDGSGGFTLYGTVGANSDTTYSVALGDVNGDGKLDVIAGNYYESSKVYLGDGSGGFTLHESLGGGNPGTHSVALGDVNGDGKLDVITGNYFSTSKVYLNNGLDYGAAPLAFSSDTTIGTDTGQRTSVALGDVNGDGRLDVIAGNDGQTNKVYLMNGAGEFVYWGTVGSDIDNTRSVALGDVNGDGNLDVITGNLGQANKVYLGTGSGGFIYWGTVDGAPYDTLTVALGDVNGDGKLDVIAGTFSFGLRIYLGNGTGGFTLSDTLYSAGDHIYSVALGDVNGDGKLDIIGGNELGIDVYQGDGLGHFVRSANLAGGMNNYVALGDVNGDGKLDIVDASSPNYNWVYLNDGLGGFTLYGNFGTNAATHSVALGDVNGDGKLDVIEGNNGLNKLYLGDGLGGFIYYGTVGTDADQTQSVALGDMNGDGTLDVIVGNDGQTSKVYLTYYEESSVSATVDITVNAINHAPTDITLSNLTIPENAGANSVVGALSAIDPDNPDTHTFTLPAGVAKNDLFDVIGGNLVAKSSFDYEAVDSYTVHVKATDAGGLFVEKDFTISVTNVNEAPTDITLSNSTIAENAGPNALIGALGAVDPDNPDTHTFTLPAGVANNALFEIVGGNLVAKISFDYETVNSYTVHVKATDAGGLFVEKDFTISVTNVNEAPVNSVPTAVQQVDASGAVTFDGAHGNLISISDVDAGTGLLKVTLTATHGTMTLHGTGGLSFDPGLGGQGDGTADATMTFFGTQSAINTALNGMTFSRDAGYYGLADLTITTNDQGNTGSGGPLSANGVANVSVEQYNTWFSGFGTEAGWDVYNCAYGTYYTHDYAHYWQHINSPGMWNYYNTHTWAPTDTLGNAPYDAGYGPPGTWFSCSSGIYNGIHIYIGDGVTYYSTDLTDPHPTYWSRTDAGFWSYYDGTTWNVAGGYDVEPVNVWFHGYGPDLGWDTYNYAGGSYYTHDYVVYWQNVAATNAWNFYNSTAWVPTDGLDRAPYADGNGPYATWFKDTVGGGTYSGYDVYIGQGVTFFSLDHTAAGATYWQDTLAGAWSYYDSSKWLGTAGFNVEPMNAWFHGYGPDLGWDTYNYTAGSYFTHDYAVYWQYDDATTSWKYYDGTSWNPCSGLGSTS